MWIKRVLPYCLLFFMLLAGPAQNSALAAAQEQPVQQAAGPVIREIADNRAGYTGGQVPTYQKLEITFQVDTSAANLQMPYDPAPPAGVQPGTGISVDALFTPDNWATVYTQPAFYYQDFTEAVKNGREWYYPTGGSAWKARFSPNRAGAWQYKIRARDASGVSESPAASFSTGAAVGHGPIRVSARETRYFEYADGTYCPGLGYNMNFDNVSWESPVLKNEPNFAKMSQNGIQLVRMWLSQWNIWGASWLPWQSIIPSQHGGYLPYTGLTNRQSYGTSQVSLEMESSYNPCMFLGFLQPAPAIKANTSYRVRVRYRTEDVTGPKTAGKPTASWSRRAAGCTAQPVKAARTPVRAQC